MTISLVHTELTSQPSSVPGESTYLRYWQAAIPGTTLYAITEEGITRTEPGRYVHMTQFFVAERPATEHGPAGGYVVQDDCIEYGTGSCWEAINALSGPHTWEDAPRQRMLQEAIEKVGDEVLTD